jgi:hypothetical protein
MFDAYTYFEVIRNTLKRTKSTHKFTRSTGLPYMEELIQNFKGEKAFFCVDDTNDGVTIQGAGGGFFDRRQYVIFILKKYKYGNMDEQHAVLEECRAIYRSICTKLVKDKTALANQMIYLQLDRMPYYEIPGYFLNGATGLYFMVTVDEPKDLRYDNDEWES